MVITWQYFGGTNFGRTAGGPLVATSYDYDAPLDEYGKGYDKAVKIEVLILPPKTPWMV